MTLNEIMTMYPTSSLIVIAFLITLVMTLITKKFTNQSRMREIKESQKVLQKKMKEHAGNLEKQRKLQQEIMESSFELMKHSFKPLIITFIPILLIFLWIRGVYLETAIASSWIWWYIGAAIVSSIILRKILKVV